MLSETVSNEAVDLVVAAQQAIEIWRKRFLTVLIISLLEGLWLIGTAWLWIHSK